MKKAKVMVKNREIFKASTYLIFVTGTTGGACVKKKLPGVNFYRYNAKNWQFTVYFAVITQRIGNLLCILS